MSIKRTLTPRQIEVMRLIEAGKSQPEIAAMLHVSLSTVCGHIQGAQVQLARQTKADRISGAV
jgi:DNA-binding NarL/FixJ family response regulator